VMSHRLLAVALPALPEVRPGDDLYTDCVLALDPDTGKLKWHFQFTPHDLYDFDATETPMLIDAVYAGEPRKLLVQANRNGFMYILDRNNGKFLAAIQFANKITWAKSIDAQGRPVLTGLKPSPEGTKICPGFAGATNWFAPSYNESTHFVYFIATDGKTRQVTHGTQILDAYSMANNGQVAGVRTSFKEPGTLVTFNVKDPANMKSLVDVNEDVLAGVRLGDAEEL